MHNYSLKYDVTYGLWLVYLDLTFSYSEDQLSYSESQLSSSASQFNHRNGVPQNCVAFLYVSDRLREVQLHLWNCSINVRKNSLKFWLRIWGYCERCDVLGFYGWWAYIIVIMQLSHHDLKRRWKREESRMQMLTIQIGDLVIVCIA